MHLKARYARAMENLYIACIAVSGVALVLITIAIPYGVFMRYVMNSAASWPEPFAVILMVMFSFVGGAAVFLAAPASDYVHGHILAVDGGWLAR